MTTFTIHTENKEQLVALKAFMKALKIKFEMNKDDKPYNPEFVAKIEKGKKEIAEGKGIKMSTKDIDNLWK
jgi:hypothetical protein